MLKNDKMVKLGEDDSYCVLEPCEKKDALLATR